jgi:hypothetical protein
MKNGQKYTLKNFQTKILDPTLGLYFDEHVIKIGKINSFSG